MNEKCTPGPWITEQVESNPPTFGVYSDDKTGSIIAQVGGFQRAPRSFKETQANAYLLGAALELADALAALPLDALDRPMEEIDAAEFVDHASEFFEAMAKARAALAKARGEL